MKTFEERLKGAKENDLDDKIWLIACFSGKMIKLCAKYGFPDDEDMFIYLVEYFLRDLDKFVIYEGDRSIHKRGWKNSDCK